MLNVMSSPIGQLSQRLAACGAASVTFLLLAGQTALAAPAAVTSVAHQDTAPTLTLISPVAGIELESTPAGPDDVLAKLRRGFKLQYADNHRTEAEKKWFVKHPDYMDRVSRARSATSLTSSPSSSAAICHWNSPFCRSWKALTTRSRIHTAAPPVSGR